LDSCEIFDFFVKDTEVLAFSSVSDLADIIEGVRKCPDIFSEIALAAQAKTRSHHTYDQRAETLLNVLRGNGLVNFAELSR
jgi:spore maturation protein CgeB